MNKLPKARTSDIIEQEAEKELLIYDLRTDKMFQLNETSKIVYQACGRSQTFQELKRRYKFTDDFVHLALGELQANDLIENYRSDDFAGLSRREIIRRVGLGSAVALPVIAALVAPRSAEAVSLIGLGQSCSSNGVCSTGCCGATASNNQICVQQQQKINGSYCRSIGSGCECLCAGCFNNSCQSANFSAGNTCSAGCQCSSGTCTNRQCVGN